MSYVIIYFKNIFLVLTILLLQLVVMLCLAKPGKFHNVHIVKL